MRWPVGRRIGSTFTTASQYSYQVDYALGVAPGSAEYSWMPLSERGNVLVAPDNLLNDPLNYPGASEVYTNFIASGNYDVLLSGAHGNAMGIGTQTKILYDIAYLNSHNINVTHWFEGACDTSNYNVTPNFAMTAIYSESSKLLTYRGATTPQGGLGGSANGYFPKVIANALSSGLSIGESILAHTSVPLSAPYDSNREYFSAQSINRQRMRLAG